MPITASTAVAGSAVVLLAFSAFFSSSEIATFSLERPRVNSLFEVEDRDRPLSGACGGIPTDCW